MPTGQRRREIKPDLLQQLKNTSWDRNLKVLQPTTDRRYQEFKSLWLSFLNALGVSEEEQTTSVQDGAPLPSQDRLKSFLMWYLNTSEGKISAEKCVTQNTMEHAYHSVTAVLQRQTGNAFNPAQKDDLRAFIRSSLVAQYGVVHVTKEKMYADEVDLEILVRQLWCRDLDEVPSNRMKVQLQLVLQLSMFLACRPGAILPTQEYAKLALRYKHFTLYCGRREGEPLKLFLKVEQEYMKGKKRSSECISIVLSQKRDLSYCPITPFLALAFADKVFNGLDTPQQLFRYCSNLDTDGQHLIPFSREKLETAIFRLPRHGRKRKARKYTDSFCYYSWYQHLQQLSRRAGYKSFIRPYTIRFGAANRAHETHDSEHVDRLLGHVRGSNTFAKHYADSIVPVDLQACMSRENGYVDIAEFRRITRCSHLPLLLSSHRCVQIEQDSVLRNSDDFIQRTKRRQQLKWRAWDAEYDDTPLPDESLTPDMARTKTLVPSSIECYGDLRTRDTRAAVLSRYDEEYAHLRSAFARGRSSLWDPSPESALNVMITAVTKDCYSEIRFHGEATAFDGALPDKDFTAPECAHQWTRLSLKEQHANAEFCRRCDMWFLTVGEFKEHCQKHYEAADPFCGLITLRGLVVAGGRCPFCMSDSAMSWRGRMKEHNSADGFRRHLDGHLENLTNQTRVKCPHPSCKHAAELSLSDLLHHFCNAHGIREVLRRLIGASYAEQSPEPEESRRPAVPRPARQTRFLPGPEPAYGSNAGKDESEDDSQDYVTTSSGWRMYRHTYDEELPQIGHFEEFVDETEVTKRICESGKPPTKKRRKKSKGVWTETATRQHDLANQQAALFETARLRHSNIPILID